jgi:hypothetical protein
VLSTVTEPEICACGAQHAVHVDCDTCADRRWLVTEPEGDDTGAWIERCPDCTSAEDTTDTDAAGWAAGQLGSPVATAHPHGDTDTSPRPYLIGLVAADARARAADRHTAQ